MPLTKVQIVSNAIALMGKKPITSLVNQSDIVTAAEQAFDMVYPSIMSKYFWRFATTIAQLSMLDITPVGGYWQYAYQLPGDYLKLIHLYPPNWDFEIYQDFQLYTNFQGNSQALYIEYQFLPLIQFLPDYFCEYLIYEIAAYLCLASAQSPQFFQALRPRADYLMQSALAADAQNRPQTPLQSAPMISRRYVTTFASG